MAGFNKDYILEKIAEIEDFEYAVSDIMTKEDMPTDAPDALKALLDFTDKAIGIDFSDLGEDSYDAYGIFCFLPDVEDDTCRYLSITITLSEEVADGAAEDLYRLINRINSRISVGAFVLSVDEKTLYYRYNVPLVIEAEDESTLHNAGLRVFDAIATVSAWIDVLMGVQDGTLSLEECLERTKSIA